MKDETVDSLLKECGKRFTNDKKYEPERLCADVRETMDLIGGITGLRVKSNKTLSLYNHTDCYKLPVKFEEYSDKLSASGKRQYEFFERLRDNLIEAGISPRNIEYHLGKGYSSKHHDPRGQKAA